ncbi:MAG: hypothetical protein EOS47_28610 [Mesorhizobium sp.]|nr:MAG: hypothetical protein EOS47_28610 [Mesorhizobium sp.]TIT29937.1 MAG: hypothetical protein E5W76_30065 [Mesorhizobium sp.]
MHLPALLDGLSRRVLDRAGRGRGTRPGEPAHRRGRATGRHVARRTVGRRRLGSARRAPPGARRKRPGLRAVARSGRALRRTRPPARPGALPGAGASG